MIAMVTHRKPAFSNPTMNHLEKLFHPRGTTHSHIHLRVQSETKDWRLGTGSSHAYKQCVPTITILHICAKGTKRHTSRKVTRNNTLL